MRYDESVASLFQAPLDQFVTERKRLAGELKAAGDKAGAARLAKLARPPISAWVVDQLWWRAREDFEAMFETAQRLRDNHLDTTVAHRDAIAKLRAQAAKILTGAGHGATEATLRRVTQTLSALAAAGGWDPDPPGALSADRDPPGFEAIGIGAGIPLPGTPAPPPDPQSDSAGQVAAATAREQPEAADRAEAAARAQSDRAEPAARAQSDRAEPAARAEIAAALRRAEAARAEAAAARHRIEAALRTAQGEVAQRERDVAKLERDLAAARSMVAQAKAVVAGLEERLAELDN